MRKALGEKVGETLLIEEIEIERPPNNYYPYYGYHANQNNYSLYSNASESMPNGQNQDGASAMFKKIKLRYEIKAIYRLE